MWLLFITWGVPKYIVQRFGLIARPHLSDLQNFFGNISGMYQGIGSTESTTDANQFLNGLDLVHIQGVSKVIVQRLGLIAQLSKK